MQRNRGRRVAFIAYQLADLPALGLTPEQCSDSLYLVAPDGQRWNRARGVFRLLTRLDFPLPLLGWIGLLPPLLWIATPLYRWVARHRTEISLRLGLTACAVPPRSQPGA